MKIIGLTGGIASGKSTVSRYLVEKGYKIVDADLIAREVVKKDSKGLKKLVIKFGQDILLEDGSLDRKKLGAIVFSDKEKLDLLNSILHPIIREEILDKFAKLKKQNESVIIFDCPLLFEGGYESLCSVTWLVSISRQSQLSRLILRDNIDNLRANAIIDSQMSLEKKAELADFILDNEADIDSLYRAIDRLLVDL